MATIERTRPAFWVQDTAASDWLLAASQAQKQHPLQNQPQIQNQPHVNRVALISAPLRQSAANHRLAGNEVRA